MSRRRDGDSGEAIAELVAGYKISQVANRISLGINKLFLAFQSQFKISKPLLNDDATERHASSRSRSTMISTRPPTILALNTNVRAVELTIHHSIPTIVV
jgi:hypothetical protein